MSMKYLRSKGIALLKRLAGHVAEHCLDIIISMLHLIKMCVVYTVILKHLL